MTDPQHTTQPPRYEEGDAQGAHPDVTPTHQSMARTAPPKRTGPVLAALPITLVFGLVGAWLWVSMGPVFGVIVLAIGVVLMLVMITALRGKRGAGRGDQATTQAAAGPRT